MVHLNFNIVISIMIQRVIQNLALDKGKLLMVPHQHQRTLIAKFARKVVHKSSVVLTNLKHGRTHVTLAEVHGIIAYVAQIEIHDWTD